MGVKTKEMKRKILFRGKRLDNGRWVEGFYSNLYDEEKCEVQSIITYQNFYDADMSYPYPFVNTVEAEVDPETVGQFTGLTDKNGNKIFEGDVLKFVGGTCDFFIKSAYGHRHEKGTIFTVKWFPSGYTLYESKTKNPLYPNCWSNIGNYDFWNNSRSFEVIGNIYDNPELLK